MSFEDTGIPPSTEDSCTSDDASNSQGKKDLVRPTGQATTPNSILIESLVKNLCAVIEQDRKHADKVYTLICDKLYELGLIDQSYRMQEFEGMRNQYERAFYQLVAHARGERPWQPVWPVNYLNADWSHYHREFDELEFIAGGGSGLVFKVRHKLDGSEYAVKKVCISASGIKSVRNYLSEVKTFASLNHPNIVQYKAAWLELGTEARHSSELASSTRSFEELSESGQDLALCQYRPERTRWATLYIQMALCQVTLKAYLAQNPQPMPRNAVMEMLQQLLAGLHYIHSKGIVHHDVKPSNIFMEVDQAGGVHVQLGDFGLACPLQKTRHSLAFGTPIYAAPEQLAGQCDPKSDLFSLGIILLELVENFGTDMERARKITDLKNGRLQSANLAAQPDLLHLVGQLVQRRPKARPSAEEMLKALRQSSADGEVQALMQQLDQKDEEIQRLKGLLKGAGIDPDDA